MPAGFTREHVAAIAALAHLDLGPAEVEMFVRQLGDILAYVEEIQQVDTSGVAPTAGVIDRAPSERTDQIVPSLDRDAALANAPDLARGVGLFRVPRVIG
jgi:aspartyl-tRNA(Asn)/glutamyl-tRNA(Gln) amidotransferase subunit C